MGPAFKLEVDKNGLARLIFDLPGEKVNKFTEAVVWELKQILLNIKNNREIKILSIVSAKKNIFIAGADIAELAKIKTAKEAETKARSGQEIFDQLAALPFPTVAIIDGACLGGGLELALACTFRLVTDNEKTSLGAPEVNLGIIPGWGGTQRLPKLIGLAQSLPMILGGKPLNAQKAYRSNLTDEIVAQEFVEQKSAEFLKECLSPEGRKKILKRRAKHSFMTTLLERNPLGRAILFRAARKDLQRKTRGQYPAPLTALKLIQMTYAGSLARGLQQEAKAFAELAPTAISKNLIQLYFVAEELKKDPGTTETVTIKEIDKAGVIGAGVMGGAIAWLFSNGGISIRLKDIAWDAIAKGFASALGIYKQLQKIKKIRAGQINLKLHKIAGTLDYRGWQNIEIVIEAVVEKIEVKNQVLAEVEQQVGPDTIICSNTSSLSINEMAKALKKPERFVGMHFFNPVNRMPLVEVIPSEKTSPQTIAAVFALAKRLKKTPVLAQDCPGFLVNRILLAYMNEAMNLLQEGADFTRIDSLIEEFGLPMGPFWLADEVGLDICYHVMQILAKGYAPRLKANELLSILYNQDKLLGKKAGKGFYIHAGKKRRANPQIAKRVPLMSKTKFSDQEIVDRCILMMLNEAVRALKEKVVAKPEYLDLALVMGIGFPAFRGGILRYADELGLSAKGE